jgi:hypothetical protein
VSNGRTGAAVSIATDLFEDRGFNLQAIGITKHLYVFAQGRKADLSAPFFQVSDVLGLA